MGVNLASTRARTALAVCFVALAVSILAYAIYNNTNSARVKQRQQHNVSLTKLFGPGGRNVRKAGQTVDMMHKSFRDRLNQVEAQCDKKKVSDAERGRLIQGTYDASKAAIDKVVASRYTAPFEPHYPPLPQ